MIPRTRNQLSSIRTQLNTKSMVSRYQKQGTKVQGLKLILHSQVPGTKCYYAENAGHLVVVAFLGQLVASHLVQPAHSILACCVQALQEGAGQEGK